jgi:hypothetical protein
MAAPHPTTTAIMNGCVEFVQTHDGNVEYLNLFPGDNGQIINIKRKAAKVLDHYNNWAKPGKYAVLSEKLELVDNYNTNKNNYGLYARKAAMLLHEEANKDDLRQTLPPPPPQPTTPVGSRELVQPIGPPAAVVPPTPGGDLAVATPGASSTTLNDVWAVIADREAKQADRDAKQAVRDEKVQARLARGEEERLQILRAMQSNAGRIDEVGEVATTALTVARTATKEVKNVERQMKDFEEQLQELKDQQGISRLGDQRGISRRLFSAPRPADERDGNVDGQEENVEHRDDNGKCNHII